MLDISLSIAFVAGVVSFFAPCVVPLLPTYVAYVSGVSLADLRERGIAQFKKTLIFSSIFYIIGFSLVFILLGVAASGIGILFRQYDFVIARIGGILLIVFGLQFAGIFNIPFLSLGASGFRTPGWIERLGYLRPFGLGVVFATVWTPCVGVVLASILTIAAVQAQALQGALLLFAYSLGISIPFLAVALTLAQAPQYLGFISKHIAVISKISGLILVALGVLLITDTYKFVNAWLFQIAFRFGYQIR